jgi:taurine dioxygenase
MQVQAAPSNTLGFAPMTGDFGAMIQGLDLDTVNAAAGAVLNDALHRYGVLVHRPGPEQALTAEQLIRLGEALGEILVYPYRTRDYPTDDMRLSYVDTVASTTRSMRTAAWHTDGTPEECPPQSALMNPLILPPQGGNTMWASMYAAWDALSPRYQAFLDGLEALHATDTVLRKMGPGTDPDIFGEGAQCVHPVALTDPVTGRRMLYVNANYTERLLGLSAAESDSVLRMLFEHINTPEFHIRWQWQPNDIVIWEERVTQHRAVADFEGRRVMRRIALKGTRPS